MNAFKNYAKNDLLVFSHLRWDFVYQRPQHLMSRFAKHRRVFFIEEPYQLALQSSFIKVTKRSAGLYHVVPVVKKDLPAESLNSLLRKLLQDLLKQEQILDYSCWYYTPMALQFTDRLQPRAIVYDCMDELSAFKESPPLLSQLEVELLAKADLVFTGGVSLFEAKRHLHKNIHAIPSSIDARHFRQAHLNPDDPKDQAHIPYPRIGYYGVLDERLDFRLIDQLAKLRPEWQLIFIGPVAKIKAADLPKAANIHYLGKRDYQDLPKYIGNWNLSLLPFAHNEATRFISPTKTPELLAAGVPVISTSIRDLVRPYGALGLVSIADTPEEIIRAIEDQLLQSSQVDWLAKVTKFLKTTSWDASWQKMAELELQALKSTEYEKNKVLVQRVTNDRIANGNA